MISPELLVRLEVRDNYGERRREYVDSATGEVASWLSFDALSNPAAAEHYLNMLFYDPKFVPKYERRMARR